MKVKEIQIDRFGVWRDLSLSLPASGLNVLYGPNEAGKTTLMRFIRGILYGFEAGGDQVFQVAEQTHPSGGLLRIEQGGRECEIRRVSKAGGRGLVSVSGLEGGDSPDRLLDRVIGETDETIYQGVFAIGLHELQELATLHDSEIARHVYGVSLGPEGQKLLDASTEITSQLTGLINIEQETGELVDLLLRYDELLCEIDDLKNCREQFRALCREREILETSIADRKGRQAGIQSQLRGHQFLQRVWPAWNQVRQYDSELEQLPAIAGFPMAGLDRLEELDQEITSLVQQRDALLDEARAARNAADELQFDRAIHSHAAAMQTLIQERDAAVRYRDNCDRLQSRLGKLGAELHEKIAQLGPAWSLERLHGVDTSPRSHRRIADAARTYRASLWRRAGLRKRYRQMARTSQQRSAELNESLKILGKRPLQEALQDASQKLRDIEQIGGLQMRERELEQRRSGIDEQLELFENRHRLPKWVYGMLVFFAVAGALAAVFGFAAAALVNGIAGLMWALLGTTCVLLAWTLKSHFESAAAELAERLRDGSRQLEIQLRETRQQIQRLTASGGDSAAGPSPAPDSMPSDEQDSSTADLIRHAVHRVTQLQEWAETHRRLQQRRRRLSELRGRLQQRQRDVSAARQHWCQTLVELGLEETVRIEDGFDQWHCLVEVVALRKRCDAAREDLRIQNEAFASFRQRVEHLGRRIRRWDENDADPIDVLSRWQEDLSSLQETHAEFTRLRRQAKSLRRQAAELRSRVDELRTERSALLVKGGAKTREEFEQRAELRARRNEVEELRTLAHAELEAAADTEPDLAIVEEDLRAYDAEENRRCIEVLEQESEELNAELQQAFEKLGSTRQMIAAIEREDRLTQTRFECRQLEDRMKRAAEEWMGLRLAARCVEQMKRRHERTCQPATLAAASDYLAQLTRGRYANVWTPLGEQHLCVDDESGEAFRVEQLSNGTREQLFLAIRLALVNRFVGEGIELPMVLDDVVVNFDQLRTEAAVDTLMEFAKKQQQQILLFTCHLHLAHLFEAKGVEPIWLPGHNPPIQQRAAG